MPTKTKPKAKRKAREPKPEPMTLEEKQAFVRKRHRDLIDRTPRALFDARASWRWTVDYLAAISGLSAEKIRALEAGDLTAPLADVLRLFAVFGANDYGMRMEEIGFGKNPRQYADPEVLDAFLDRCAKLMQKRGQTELSFAGPSLAG